MFLSRGFKTAKNAVHTMQSQYRSMAIYAVGEGFTGAMGQENSLEIIHGHFDEDETDKPTLIYAYDDVQQAAAGWGCTAFLDTQGQIQIIGRPQDLVTLFRMNRMPRQIRNWVNSKSNSSDTTIVGNIISNLIGFASGGDEAEEWAIAKEMSLLKEWTKLDLAASSVEKRIGDTSMTHIICSAGLMAMIGNTGTLYTTGINSRGQCGIGKMTNNVWTPEQVRGISLSEKKDNDDAEQDLPVIQVALGFQHGYALTRTGQLFSWGKGSRGQLGRDLEADQDSTARLMNLDDKVAQIASGMHHGSLLTNDNKVYVWGKSMGRKEDEQSKKKAVDGPVPEQIQGLPLQLKVLKISCGSHHTSILLEDGSIYAIGIASDEAVPLLDPVELLPAGQIDLPVRQFEAHFDRTTVVDNQGQVFQVHLWKDEALREHAYFTPQFVDTLLDEGQSIQSIHRGWLHTIIVTKQD
jgi:alpha-tubulin suppressor-like RCC1 family protein